MLTPALRTPIIKARDIVKSFGSGGARTTVLHGISTEIASGELTFIVGESGSGKTTLISILSAILTPDAGSVAVAGTTLDPRRQAELARFRRRTMGFVFQQFNLLPRLTAAENVAIPRIADGQPWAKSIREASDMLARLGLAERAKHYPSQLSGGQQQRVAIARALIHAPAVVICDEPTASLDASSGRTVMELLRDVGLDRERAVVVVTHDSRTFGYADRIIALEDGRIVDDRRTSGGEP